MLKLLLGQRALLVFPRLRREILIDINDRFPRDFLSDIFSKVVHLSDSPDISKPWKDGNGLSYVENCEPKHRSYFQKLAQGRFVQDDVSLINQDHLGSSSVLIKVEEEVSDPIMARWGRGWKARSTEGWKDKWNWFARGRLILRITTRVHIKKWIQRLFKQSLWRLLVSRTSNLLKRVCGCSDVKPRNIFATDNFLPSKLLVKILNEYPQEFNGMCLHPS